MRLIAILALFNTLAAAGLAIGMASQAGLNSGPDAQQIASASKTVPNSAPFAVDVVAQSAARWKRRSDLYRYFCYALLCVVIFNAVALALLTRWRPPAR